MQQNQNNTIKLYPMYDGVETPSLGSALASGYDLKVWGDHQIAPGETKVLPTGLKLAESLPPGIDMQVRPRSSTPLKHGLIVSNSPGTIDGDYTGEIGIIVTRLLRWEDLKLTQFFSLATTPNVVLELGESIRIEHGSRLAQLVFGQLHTPRPFIVMTDINQTREERGGFGSTGV